MRILISNDDGYQADGICVLHQALSPLGDVVRVAPDRDRSGASNSLTLRRPLRAERIADDIYSVDGTPTDCVHLGLTGLLDDLPDLVVSGINHGPNLGDDVMYSGTVAAATEGRHLGLPALALSINSYSPVHLIDAAYVAQTLVRGLTPGQIPANTILNVNIPDLPRDEIKGFQVTRLGNRHQAESVVQAQDPRGDTIWWVGPPGPEQDAGPGTDFHAVRDGYVSITPLHVDLTRHKALQNLAIWAATLAPIADEEDL